MRLTLEDLSVCGDTLRAVILETRWFFFKREVIVYATIALKDTKWMSTGEILCATSRQTVTPEHVTLIRQHYRYQTMESRYLMNLEKSIE